MSLHNGSRSLLIAHRNAEKRRENSPLLNSNEVGGGHLFYSIPMLPLQPSRVKRTPSKEATIAARQIREKKCGLGNSSLK